MRSSNSKYYKILIQNTDEYPGLQIEGYTIGNIRRGFTKLIIKLMLRLGFIKELFEASSKFDCVSRGLLSSMEMNSHQILLGVLRR